MEGLYLIHTREFISTNKEIYKIGRSSNIENRVRNYPNGSKILLAIINKNSIQCEKDLIKKFKITFTQKQFYGNEYFEGNKYKMVNMMCNYINIDNEECERKEDIEKEKERKKKEREKEKKDKEKEKEKKKKEKKNEKMKEKIKKRESKIIECPKCNVDFKYISILKRHLENSARCSSNDVYIKNTINNINKNTNTDNLFICNDCNKHFKFKTSIYRHKSISKCSKNKIVTQ